jgi:hypothetical protein
MLPKREKPDSGRGARWFTFSSVSLIVLGGFGIVAGRPVPGLIAEAVKLLFRGGTVKPLKCVFNRHTVALKNLL